MDSLRRKVELSGGGLGGIKYRRFVKSKRRRLDMGGGQPAGDATREAHGEKRQERKETEKKTCLTLQGVRSIRNVQFSSNEQSYLN